MATQTAHARRDVERPPAASQSDVAPRPVALRVVESSVRAVPARDRELSLEFSKLYLRWFTEVSRWIVRLGGPSADVDDIAQQVFVVMLRRLPDFEGDNVGGWLYQIARRCVRDWRRQAWSKYLSRGNLVPLDDLTQPGSSPAETVELKNDVERLRAKLDTLGVNERNALVLFAGFDCKGHEIAEIQGVPLNTVWTRIRRARMKVQSDVALRRDLALAPI